MNFSCGPLLRSALILILFCWRTGYAQTVQDVESSKNCDQTALSPDGHWLAASRTYTQPRHGQIWQDTDPATRLVVWSCDGSDLDSSIEWEDSSIKIDRIVWSSDSRFLVLVCSAANGLKPWAHPTLIYDTKTGALHNTSPLGTIVSKDVSFPAPDILRLSTGTEDSPRPVDFDLSRHIGDLPVLTTLKMVSPP